MPPIITVGSGFTVSSGFRLDRSDRAFTVAIPSSHAGTLAIQFALTDPTLSTVASADFFTLMRSDGTGSTYFAGSGGIPALVAPIQPATAWARLLCGATPTSTNTYRILSIVAV